MPEPGSAPFARLKFEGGVHRVQRVPVTESQGRIHTSAAGVLILPEAEDVDVVIDANDLRIDVYRSSGPGGQSVNTTDSAVRITHLPTGVVVSCQNEKSQLQNKESALRILRARLLAVAEEQAAKEASDARRSQVRTVDRSERIRTYNFPENRFSDHRVGFKSHNLDQVLDGDLDAVIDACVEADQDQSAQRRGELLMSWTEDHTIGGRVTVRDVLFDAEHRLSAVRVPSPSVDAAELVAFALGTTRNRLFLQEAVTAEEKVRIEQLLTRRLSRVPLQHIIGKVGFRRIELEVGPGVFIPRPETELVTEAGLRVLAEQPEDRRIAVDLCSGSGAIAISLATEVPGSHVHAVELSIEAVEWTRRNVASHAEKIAAVRLDRRRHPRRRDDGRGCRRAARQPGRQGRRGRDESAVRAQPDGAQGARGSRPRAEDGAVRGRRRA